MTVELEEQRHFWEHQTQREGEKRKQYQEDRLHLNLQPNQDGLLQCRGRIQGNYPIYTFLSPQPSPCRKLVQQTHEETLHGMYLELLPNMEMTDLKRLIARRGRPVKIYSDNGGTFVGATKWIKTSMEDERVNNFLAHQGIKWQ